MQLKTLIRFPIDIRRARRLLDEKAAPCSHLTSRPIALDLRTTDLLFDCGRHLASLAHHAKEAGSPLYFRCHPVLLAAMARKHHGREMLAEPHSIWVPPSEPLPENALVLCDHGDAMNDQQVRMLVGRDILRDLPVMPYPMHPATQREMQEVDLQALRSETDRRGILFAGNQKRSYGDAKMMRNFGVLSRLDVLQTLAREFPSRVIDAPVAPNAVTPRDHGQTPIAICDSRNHSIASADWLPTIARSDFFLCCPGASQPTCHHLTEAMSVGTIPILEYGNRITPELRDGENAICFRGTEGLIQAIGRIDRLSDEQRSRLRRNVTEFYDRHLCGTQFLSGLRDGRFGTDCRSVCMPFHEVNFYQLNRRIAA